MNYELFWNKNDGLHSVFFYFIRNLKKYNLKTELKCKNFISYLLCKIQLIITDIKEDKWSQASLLNRDVWTYGGILQADKFGTNNRERKEVPAPYKNQRIE